MHRRFLTTVLACLLDVAPALAGEGVIEINQAAALQGGITPGDVAGFPVSLTQQGSYRLTGNLDSPIGTGAIEITATLVTLDLGGFVVRSTNSCTGYPIPTCSVTDGAPGISSGQYLVAVRNGSIFGMGGSCIRLTGPSSEVDQVRAIACGMNGIQLGGAGRVTRSFSGGNSFHGILIEEGGFAEANEVRANGEVGIYFSGDRLRSLAIENQAYDNANNWGIFLAGPGLASRNVVSGNSSTITGLSYGDNLCNGVLC